VINQTKIDKLLTSIILLCHFCFELLLNVILPTRCRLVSNCFLRDVPCILAQQHSQHFDRRLSTKSERERVEVRRDDVTSLVCDDSRKLFDHAEPATYGVTMRVTCSGTGATRPLGFPAAPQRDSSDSQTFVDVIPDVIKILDR